jgi:probable F420-dependent oxidoreductase
VKFMMDYPILSDVDDGAWIDGAKIAEFARVAEASGLDALSLTDHPAPSKKWIERGGHETFDPFVALMHMASSTTTLRVMTHLIVVPYRNPFVTAKSIASVDRLSGGRGIFTLGTGYLRSEFSALGADMDERNELFDEAVDVMRGVWADDDFHYEGRHFKSYGVIMKPGPVTMPHPPLWVGGNARVVRRRVAAWADGWAPLLGGPTLLNTARTPSLGSDEDLAAMIREIKGWMEEAGRDPSKLDVACGSMTPLPEDASVQQQLDQLGELGEMGITWTGARIARRPFPEMLDAMRRYGDEVISKAR